MKRSSLVLIAVLAAAVVTHFSVAWQDLPTLARNGYLYDDSFYAFQIARNIAGGSGPTFDGSTLTNGFQPLYVALLVPLYRVSGGDPVLPIHLALALLSLLTVTTAFVLYRILLRYVSAAVAVTVAAFWVLSPVVIRQAANGLETALSLFMLSVSVYYYLSRVRDADTPPRSALMKLGVLLGFAVLARLDQLFLVLAIALDYLLLVRGRRVAARTGAGNAAAMIGAAVAVYAPWMVYGWFAVGRLLPESGAATRFLSLAYAPFFGLGPAGLAATGPDGSFVAAHLARAASVLKLTPATHALFRAVERAGISLSLPEAAAFVSNLIGVALLVLFAVWVFRRARSRRAGRIGELTFLLLFSVCLVAAYSFYVFGAFFFIRYFYPVHFVAMIFSAFAISAAVEWLGSRTPALRRVLVAACVVYVSGHLFMTFNCCYRSTPVYHFYDIARWVEANTDPEETIGVFQSGTIGYLSNRRVVNLDGKVNGDALAALRRGDLDDYIRSAGIDVLMDNTRVIRLFLGDEHRFDAGACFYGAESGLPGWVGYRLPGRPARGSGPGASATTNGASPAR